MNRRPIQRSLPTLFTALAAGTWLSLALWTGPVQPALAHGVYIFAWPDGDRICTDSYFSKSSKVRDGLVSMRDAAGEVLQSGRTGQDGGLCLARPDKPGDLFFVVEAGEGHRGEFKLRAEDLDSPNPAPVSNESSPPEAASPTMVTKETAPDNSEESLRRIIREELQSQLSPIRKALAEAQQPDQSPGPREIVGGLGWVVGLFGLAFWWTGRKKK